MLGDLKVALVHDYLNAWGGAEKVVAAIHKLFPQAPVYTSLYDLGLKERVPAMKDWEIRAPRWLQGKWLGRFPKYITFTLPWVFEALDFSDYDLVISSSAAFAKGVLTPPRALHLNYCHTPPRFLYGYPGETDKRTRWYWQPLLRPLDSYLRLWDFQAAQRPDYLVCNSQTVQERIRKFYRREATVIYPPIDLPGASASSSPASTFSSPSADGSLEKSVPRGLRPAALGSRGLGYFLVVSRLSAFKNIDMIIEACGRLSLPLKVAGAGREEERLRQLVARYPQVEMLGFVADENLPELFGGAWAFLCATQDEDFGITAVEANAYGVPVIALRSGGLVEAVAEGVTGEFFEEATVECLADRLSRYKDIKYNAEACRQWAERFSKERFQRKFLAFVEEKWAAHHAKDPL